MDRDSLKQQYQGDTAAEYEASRNHSEKWKNEQTAVKRYLHSIDSRYDTIQEILDIPVGTGRFFDIYRDLDARIMGVDVSEDMIEQARKNVSDSDRIDLMQGDIFRLDEYDIDPDIVVCVRLMNWLEFDDFRDAIQSIAETDAKHVIISVRTYPTDRDPNVHSGSSRLVGSGVHLVRRTFQILRSDGPMRVIDSASSYLRRKIGFVPTITIHPQEDVISVFKDCGFDIDERALVDEGEDNISEYHIYLLNRSEML